MKKVLLLSALIIFTGAAAVAEAIQSPPTLPEGDANVQFVYNTRSNTLTNVTSILSGAEAEKVFNAIKASYPNLVSSSGNFGMQPEINLPNLSCGLQVISFGPPGLPPADPVYRCYFSVALPQ